MKNLKLGIALSTLLISTMSFAQKAIPTNIKPQPIKVSAKSLETTKIVGRADQQKRMDNSKANGQKKPNQKLPQKSAAPKAVSSKEAVK